MLKLIKSFSGADGQEVGSSSSPPGTMKLHMAPLLSHGFWHQVCVGGGVLEREEGGWGELGGESKVLTLKSQYSTPSLLGEPWWAETLELSVLIVGRAERQDSFRRGPRDLSNVLCVHSDNNNNIISRSSGRR